MVDERFPLRAYLRRLDYLERECAAWSKKYRRIGSVHENDVMAWRYTERADLLDGMSVQLHAMFHELEQLPRLS